MNPLTLTPGSFKSVDGRNYGTPKEVWGYRSPSVPGSPVAVARAFIAANEDLLGSDGVALGDPRVVESLGAHHVIFQQRHLRQRVHRAYVTTGQCTAQNPQYPFALWPASTLIAHLARSASIPARPVVGVE